MAGRSTMIRNCTVQSDEVILPKISKYPVTNFCSIYFDRLSILPILKTPFPKPSFPLLTMANRQLTKAQEEGHMKATINGGFKGAIAGLGLGLIATIAVGKAPAFQSLKPAYKSLFVVSDLCNWPNLCANLIFLCPSGTSAGMLFGADSAREKYEKTQLGYMDENEFGDKAARHYVSGPTTKDKVLDYLNDNRWTIIGVSWVASLAGSLAYTFSNKYLNAQQKLVQARMYAQAFTIAILMASAGISIAQGDDSKGKVDESDVRLRAVLGLPEQGPVPHLTPAASLHKHH
ncbi:hypothetical protein BC938DRAFT_472103 [Jimgerdemannia flammicorona]|uniref:HIG1 domain-containing protein n=1 Tax=Jimgerdemannia flammicorona TaxID=994334 RepID=A0A433QU49_9FUNG|nr:hypothetical protein BC938DRAFT_472103 [Jimgerdemannia flammicorona]